MSKWQLALLWAAPVATVVALASFYAAVGGAADSVWPLVTLFSLVVAAIGTVLVSITSRRLPGVQWLYGYWIGLGWWLSGVGVQANIHQTRPDREPPWLWVAVLAVTTLAVAASHGLRSRRLPTAPALSQRPVVWYGATGINQFALPFFPIGLIAVFGGLVSPVSTLLTFGLPIVAITGASMKCTVTIFEDQVQVENWLGMALFRVPLSDVETVGAVAPRGRFGMFLGLAPGWEMLSGESVIRTSIWPRPILTLRLEHGEEVSIGVKHSLEAAQAVHTLLFHPLVTNTVPPSLPALPSPPPALPPSSLSPNMPTAPLPPPVPSAVAPEWPSQ